MIKAGKECGSKEKWLGKFSSLKKCARAVKRKGYKYFDYSTSTYHKGRCYAELTSSAACKEGMKKATGYNFYGVGEQSYMIKRGKECGSKEKW